MVLGYLASSWNSLRSGKKTESQQSQDEIASNPPSIQARSDVIFAQDTKATEEAKMGNDDYESRHLNMTSPPLGSQSRRGRKDRQKKRKRRPSIDTSILAPGSESGDVASIPYRADERAERDTFVAHEGNELKQDQISVTGDDAATQKNPNSDIPAHGTPGSLTMHVQSLPKVSVAAVETISEQHGRSPIVKVAENGSRNRYPCPGASQYNCGQTFTMLSAARRHMKAVHSKEKFICPICGNVYARADSLREHQLAHIPGTLQVTESVAISQREATMPEASNNSDNYVDREAQARTTNTDVVINEGFVGIKADVDMEDAAEIPHMQPNLAHENAVIDSDIVQVSKAASGLKRKRENDGSIQNTIDQTSKKRRKDVSLPPQATTSVTARDNIGFNKAQKSSNWNTKPLKSGNLNEFAKPWLPGSELHHPVFNPRSPRSSAIKSQLVVPESSRASIERKKLAEAFEDPVEETPLAGKKKRLAAYSSAKGKQRADPDVEYTSPEQTRQWEGEINRHEQSSDDEIEGLGQNQTGMATSIAKRVPFVNTSNTPRQSVNCPEEETEPDESGASADEDLADQNGDVYLCQECGRKFSSLKLLRKHEKRPGVHKLIQRCEECKKTFGSREMLRCHQRDLGHGDGTGYSGRKGPFSAAEISKLHKWRNRFCDEYDIGHVDFNNMMTDSLRRHKGFVWPYKFIAKADFLQEYYDILPGRNRRSMHRYRERAFQNLASNLEWTQQDDQELADLVNELGQKWVEIGLRMSRTSDSVNQRWRNKVQYRGNLNDGEWLKDETEQLVKVVNQVKRESGISLDPHADVKMPWDSVSRKMKGKRTAQQCSNKWRLLYTVRKNGVFLKPDGTTSSRSNSSTPVTSKTPSKMSQRLAGVTPSTNSNRSRARRKPISDQYVHDSDDDNVTKASQTLPEPEPELESGLESEPETEPDSEVEAIAAAVYNNEPDPNSGEANGRRKDTNLSEESEADNSSGEVPSKSFPTGDEQDGQGVYTEETATAMGPLSDMKEIHNTRPQYQNEISSRKNALDDDLHESASITEPGQQLQDSQSDPGHTSSENDTPDLPRNPLFARTPHNNTTLSQAFNLTQANTSAIRAPRTGAHNSSQPTLPSPQVPIRARPVSTLAQKPIYHGSQSNDHDASSDESSSDETSETDSSSEDSDNDTMVQDTRKESFLQSLRSVVSQRNTDVGRSSSQSTAKKVNWAKALQGQHEASEESSSEGSSSSRSDDE